MDKTLKVSLTDTGIGIDKKVLKHMFKSVLEAGDSEGGAGIGLKVIVDIIEKHNGRIYAESELGKGATFVVELPIPTAEKGD